MKKNCFLILAFFIVIAVESCKSFNRDKLQVVKNPPVNATDYSSEYVLADTIVYDVIVKNSNPDDKWQEECLRQFHRKAFIDELFNAAYKNKIKIYDFFTGEIIPPDQLKKIEKQDDYNRDAIGEIRFTEQWYYNPAKNQFNKKILSLVLAYQVFNSDGTSRGYKPVFKILMN